MEDYRLQHTSLSDQIYHILKQDILQHKYVPGTRLVDYQIAQQLGVSRTPVREAIFRLARTGLLENSEKRGFYVLSATHKDVDEWYDIRLIIDEAVVTRLIRPATGELAQQYAQQLQQLGHTYMQEYDAHLQEFSAVDEHFHNRMVEMLDNQRIAQFYANTINQLRVFRCSNDALPTLRDASHQIHLTLLRRIREHDLPGALDAVHHHVEFARKEAHAWLDSLSSST